MNIRPFEFRVWDTKSKNFVKYSDADKDDGVMQGIFDLNKTSLALDNCIFQQFTSLLDKNGKKIFEGDILSWDRRKDKINPVGKGEVTWATNGAKYLVGGGDLDMVAWQSKVIGNIYENPELLK